MNKPRGPRAHVIVKECPQKEESKVIRDERSCSTRESSPSEDLAICHVCGKEYRFENMHKIEINGKIMNICKNCAETFHVLA
jgi:hypothetical protein